MRKVIGDEIAKLLVAGFIREILFADWLANPVLVEKNKDAMALIKKWRMCIDYTHLNKACPRDPFSLPRMEQVDRKSVV